LSAAPTDRYYAAVKITAYVPCHNGEKTVGQALEALRQQTRPADQYLFINDHCTDQSPAIAREKRFEVVDVAGGKGLAAGRNVALKHATGDVLLGIDADVVIEANYIQELEKKFAEHPQVAGICGRLDERYRDTTADLWRAVHMAQHHGPREMMNPRVLTGATSACRVPVLKQLGGWNERYQTNAEDVDLSTRLTKAGFSFLYAPNCQAWHLRRDTTESVLRTHWNWNYFGYEHRFATPADWIGVRLPAIWEEFRLCRVIDLKHPVLCPITLLFPFSWIIRDLNALQPKIKDIGHIADVIAIAGSVVLQYGMPEKHAVDMCNWLTQLLTELNLPAKSDQRLHKQIAHWVKVRAQESIPDVTYWRNFQV
jgi:biofilm PGA synthesis N-glycosyltransferase PgaC